MTALMPQATEAKLAAVNLSSNEDRLAAVRAQKARQSFIYWLSSAGALFMLFQVNPVTLLLLSASSSAATVIAKCARIETVFRTLNREFKNTDMEVFSFLEMVESEVPKREYDQIDLHLRFRTPKKTQIFITIRSMGKNTIVYSEEKESLLIKRRNRNRSVVTPCPLIGLNENREWLTRNRKEVGLSSRDVTKSVTAKILVIWNETKIARHREELYSDIGHGKYLTLFKKGTKTFVVEQERLADFIRDWLTHLKK